MAAEGATYGPLRIPELRWLCQQRGLTPYGRKRELLSRLEEQDQQEEVSMWRKIIFFFFVCVFLWFHWYLRMINFFWLTVAMGHFR
jgi:uncharacterized ion transporter superfamily protein YfcC